MQEPVESTPAPVQLAPAADDELSSLFSEVEDAAEPDFLPAAAEGEATLQEVLLMPSVCKRGTVDRNSVRGSVLYATAVSPRHLAGDYQTRVTYLSALFRYWRGGLRFRFRVTKGIYQEAKFLLAFVPNATPADLRATEVDVLMSSQCSAILASSNQTVAELDIPFYATGNWLAIDASSGAFIICLVDPLITSQDTTATIHWTLEVASSPVEGLRFRYAIMPRVKNTGGNDGGGTGPGGDNDVEPDNQPNLRALTGTTYARSSTSVARAGMRIGEGWTTETDLYVHSSCSPVVARASFCFPVPIPKSSSGRAALAQKLCSVDLSCPFSFRSNVNSMQRSLVPYLPRSLRVNGRVPREDDYHDGKGKAKTPWFTNAVLPSTTGGNEYISWELVAPEWHVLILDEEAGRFFVEREWGVLMIVQASTPLIVRFKAESLSGGWLTLGYDWKSFGDKQKPILIKRDSPLVWVDCPSSLLAWNKENIVVDGLTRALDTALLRAPYPYINVYTDAWLEAVGDVQAWLTNENATEVPPAAFGRTFALSASQTPAYFDMLESLERGIFTWIFNLFSGDSDSPWAKVARVADMIFEFCLPLILSYDGTAAPVEVGPAWRLSFERFTENADGMRMAALPEPKRHLTNYARPSHDAKPQHGRLHTKVDALKERIKKHRSASRE